MAELDFLMRVFEDRYGWLPIESAPLDENVRLTVSDSRGGDPYRLPYPCRRTAAGWISTSKGTPLAVTPLMWKPHYEARKWTRERE